MVQGYHICQLLSREHALCWSFVGKLPFGICHCATGGFVGHLLASSAFTARILSTSFTRFPILKGTGVETSFVQRIAPVWCLRVVAEAGPRYQSTKRDIIMASRIY